MNEMGDKEQHQCEGGFGAGMSLDMLRTSGGDIYKGKFGWVLVMGGEVITIFFCPFCPAKLE